MKTSAALLGFAVLLLLGCQLPLSAPGSSSAPAVSAAPGKASLAVSIRTNGFTFVPTKAVQAGRFVIAPTPTPGVAYYVLHDPSAVLADVTGDSTAPLTDIAPGAWNLTVTLKDLDGVRVLGSATQAVTLNAGPNPVTVTVNPTRAGTGRIDVSYSWVTAGIDAVTVLLDQLTLTDQGGGVYTMTPTSITPAVPTVDLAAKTAHFVMDLPSGSYRVTLKLQAGGFDHPTVTGTAEVYDGVTSLASVNLSAGDLNGPPDPIVGPITLNLSSGYPLISWNPVASTTKIYKIFRNGVFLQDISAMGSSFLDTGYPASSSFFYTVVAANDFGTSPGVASPSFEGVSSVAITPPGLTRMGVGQNQPFTASVSPGSASFQGVIWTTDQAFSVPPASNAAQVRGLRLGQGSVAATTVEASSFFDLATVQVEANVVTLAGQPGVNGNADGTGSGASFYQPNCLTLGPDGNLYLVDMFTNIRRITPGGTVTTLGSNSFTFATGIAVDAALNVYVADGDVIYKAPYPSYNAAVLAGGTQGYLDATGPAAQFHTIRGLALDTAGTYLYAADGLNHVIRKVNTATGVVTTYAGNQALGSGNTDAVNPLSAQFAFPSGLAFDKDGNLYVVDFSGYQRVRKIAAAAGPVTTVAGDIGGTDTDGDATTARFAAPYGIAVDGQDLYVAEWVDTVRRVRLPGPGQPLAQVITLAGAQSAVGTTDGLGGDARFGGNSKGLTGIAASHGNVYVVDTGNSTVRKIVTTPFDAIDYTDGEFSDPAVMQYNWGAYLNAGDGYTGNLRVGTVVLFDTGANHGKALVTGIDDNYQGNLGDWRVHLDWVTWDSGGTVVSSGKDLTVVNAGASTYIDFETGTIVPTSVDGDVYLSGTDAGNRYFNAANISTKLGLYK